MLVIRLDKSEDGRMFSTWQPLGSIRITFTITQVGRSSFVDEDTESVFSFLVKVTEVGRARSWT